MVLVEKTKEIAVVKLDKPSKLNSLDTGTLTSLSEIVYSQCRNTGLKAVLLTGEGRVFSSGIDLEEIASAEDPSSARKPFEALGSLLKALLECSIPTAVYLNGPAVAGGGEIALATDIRLASPKAYLSWPEIRWGLIAPMLASYLAATSNRVLLEKALTGGRIGAEEAVKLGLINAVVESLDDAISYLDKLLETSTSNPEAQRMYLEYSRRILIDSLPRINELVRLAENPELIEKARRFISK
ncbi:MAG: enoyl-CoA hydratase/isomerase family protein [Desulfurococcales archaeon]|nr:enoyl-CoA hydratase/isomerase family protein [Desulfurococcales archaeon]